MNPACVAEDSKYFVCVYYWYDLDLQFPAVKLS